MEDYLKTFICMSFLLVGTAFLIMLIMCFIDMTVTMIKLKGKKK